jgi:putative ABC transport system substrate-binding protein
MQNAANRGYRPCLLAAVLAWCVLAGTLGARVEAQSGRLDLRLRSHCCRSYPLLLQWSQGSGRATAIAHAGRPLQRAAIQRADGVVQPWFQLQPDVLERWNLTPVAGRLPYFTLAPKRQPGAGVPKHVLLLFGVKSLLFNATLSVVCGAFLSNRIPIVFTLMYFGSPRVGLAELRFAEQQRMDLIFSVGSATTAFMHAQYQHGRLPVVTIMSKDPVLLKQMPNYTVGSGTNMAYTSVNVPIQVQMAYLRTLEPGLKSIGVLYGLDDPSASSTQVLPLKQLAAPLHIRVVDITVRGVQTARQDLTIQMPRATALMKEVDPSLRQSVLWVTASTSVLNEIHTVNQLAGRVPVLSVFPDLVDGRADSAVLSIGVSFQTASELATRYGIEILRGEAMPGQLKVGTVSPPDIAIDFQKAREDGLKIPFSFFESASVIYNFAGKLVRNAAANVSAAS